MDKFDDHPRKQAVITPLACHLEEGIPPYTGDKVSSETFEYTAAIPRRTAAPTRTEACSVAHFPQVSSCAFAANAFNSFSKFSFVSRGSPGSFDFFAFGDFVDDFGGMVRWGDNFRMSNDYFGGWTLKAAKS